MRIRLLLSLSLSFLYYSCTDRPEKGILIGNNSNIDFYDIIDSILLTPLETSEGFMIGEIDKIKVFDSLYYLLDARKTNTLYAFNKKGQPLVKFGTTGRAPEEYLSIYDFDTDDKNNKLFILCHPSKVFITDRQFHIEKIISLKGQAERIAYWDNRLYCYSHDKRRLMTIDMENGEMTEILAQNNIANNYMSDLPVFHKLENELYYNAIGSDIVYKIGKDQLQEAFTINYEGKQRKIKYLNSHEQLSPQEAIRNAPPSLHFLFKQQDKLSVIYTYGALIRMCTFDSCKPKTTSDGIVLNRIGNLQLSVHQHTLITSAFISASEIPFDDTKTKLTINSPLSTDIEANPVLITYFIK